MTKKVHVLVKKDDFEVKVSTSIRELCRSIGIANSTYHSHISKKGYYENKEYIIKANVIVETINKDNGNLKEFNRLYRGARESLKKPEETSNISNQGNYEW